MEKIEYTSGNRRVTIDLWDWVNASWFLQECIEMMKMLWYNNESIERAIDNINL